MKDRARFIYLMLRSDGAWKVGFTTDLERRRLQLQNQFLCGFSLVQKWRHPQAWLIETVAHRFLQPFRDDTVEGRETYRASKRVVVVAIEQAIQEVEAQVMPTVPDLYPLPPSKPYVPPPSLKTLLDDVFAENEILDPNSTQAQEFVAGMFRPSEDEGGLS